MKTRYTLAFLLFVAPLAAQTTIRLDPVADATIRSDQPTTNAGTATELGLAKDRGLNGIYFMRTHFQFDVTKLQGQKPVVSATLRFYQNRAVAAGTLPVSVYRLTQNWSETAVTWNNKPADDNQIVTTVHVGSSGFKGWREFDVTSLVKAWATGAAPNQGLLIRLARESTAGAYRPAWGPSREHATTTERPHLLVEVSDNREFGRGCGPVATWPKLALTAGTSKLGSQFTITGSLLAPSATSLTAIGLSNTTYNGLALPYTLDPRPFPPCELLVAPEILIYSTATNQGQQSWTFTVPNTPIIRGVSIFFQMASPQATPHLTSGLEIIVY